MSTFDDDNYRWRETYFVFMHSGDRPDVAAMEKAFGRLRKQFELSEIRGDENGAFESVRVIAPEAFSAIDVGYLEGEEVLEQLKTLRQELDPGADDPEERKKLSRLADCDARLDVLHFERLAHDAQMDDDEPDEMLDPGALLIVMERLTKLCKGVGVDPASCAVL